MKNLCLKLNCEGLSPEQVAKLLRELADTIETTPEAPGGSKLIADDGREVGVIMRPAKPMKLDRAKRGEGKRRPLGHAIALATALDEELRAAHGQATGAEQIVLFDLIEPAARIRERLAHLDSVTA